MDNQDGNIIAAVRNETIELISENALFNSQKIIPQAQKDSPLTNFTLFDAIVFAFLLSIILISIIGNSLVCLAIFTDRRLRKLGNAFIVSLAVADLFVSCLVMTFALCNDFMNYWAFGEWFCDIWISFDIMCSTASILNLCAISLDRFIHIKDCLLYNQIMTKRKAIFFVFLIWFISSLLSFVPMTFGWGRATKNDATIRPTYSESSIDSKRNHYASRENRPDLEELMQSKDFQDEHRLSTSPISEFISHDETDKSNASRNQSDASGILTPSIHAKKEHSLYQEAASKMHVERLKLSSLGIGAALNTSSTSLASYGKLDNAKFQCSLVLTPTYAVISSTISFYLPCIIMLGLYIKLYACAMKHARNIQKNAAPTFQEQNKKIHQQTNAENSFKKGPSFNSSEIKMDSTNKDKIGDQHWASSKQINQKNVDCELINYACLEKGELKAINANLPSEAQVSNEKDCIVKCPDNIPNVNDSRREQYLQNHRLVGNQHFSSTQFPAGYEVKPFLEKKKNDLIKQRIQQHKRYGLPVSGQQLATQKAAITLGIIMGTFLLCWVPFFCINIIKAFCKDCVPNSLFKFLSWLGYANSALNPIIYGIHNAEFRNAFIRIFYKHFILSKKDVYMTNVRNSKGFE